MSRESGFTLVELMVVTAIIAILASVATPAYINYQNRAKQDEAIEALLRAKVDQEVFWADNNRFANTIGCLYSFGNACSVASYLTSASTDKSYAVSINGSTITAVRIVNGATDTVRITLADSDRTPTVVNPAALSYSIFDWLFN